MYTVDPNRSEDYVLNAIGNDRVFDPIIEAVIGNLIYVRLKILYCPEDAIERERLVAADVMRELKSIPDFFASSTATLLFMSRT